MASVARPAVQSPALESASLPWTRHHLSAQLRALGLVPSRDVLVHSSLRAIGRIPGGPATLLAAIQDAVGPAATIVVPAQTTANSTTSRVHLQAIAGLSDADRAAHLAALPPFDPAATPSQGMGILAEYVRTRPGAHRSAHPTSSFAALGPSAARITATHPPESHLGDDSPLGALERSAAQVLLLGVGFDVATVFHLAEYRVRPRLREYRSKVLASGAPDGRWLAYQGIHLDDSDFAAIGRSFAATGVVRIGPFGNTKAACFPLAEAAAFAEQWLHDNRPVRPPLPGGDRAKL